MINPGLEIGGSYRNTNAGKIDWWYGGGSIAWLDLSTALLNIPTNLRQGRIIGIYSGTNVIEYWWPDSNHLLDNDIVIYSISGPTGSQGFQGLIGSTGSQGFQGLIGSTGSQGFQGLIGSTGSQGFQGLIGSTGSQGFQGLIGSTGSQGFQGLIGSTGSQGFQGFQGLIGSTGNQGFQGLIGSTGSQGFQGLIGSTGSQGFQGFQGLIGSTGNQGFQGPDPVFPTTLMYTKVVSTYASMITDSTPTKTTLYRVSVDENKNYINSTYLWFPDGKRIWIASTDDN